ncbi:penicillin-binding protein activator [Magnetospirillum sp. UT-4]|uniref:penicillin-binding protein activator n=1 Tax=Magnetospirillum sp. UT-4 TaxID=2681467 RepID=UPI0013800156|nr:penicillin-binding protein activator [Magnetospirillum sp. UT-4]CAA7616310.1 putative ABC-type branched-chain amino acid transport systems, periplasmic component [Magnetospirillum sp. UT-4]
MQLPGAPVPPAAPAAPAPAAPLPAPPAAMADKDEVRAALLVPLSGSYAAYGQAMSNAAQLALFEVGDQRLNLIPLDTRGTPEGAAAAARQAVAQGADIVLGPLFSPEVKAAAQVAREAAVPVLAFTTDRTAIGQGIYTLGFLPRSQVARVVAHARQQGKERFALLARSDEYGRTVADAFREAVAAQGGQVVKVEFYDPAADPTQTVKRFTESERRAAAHARDKTQPVQPPPFDAVMLPDEGTRLRSVASLVTYFEVDPGDVRFLGTMLWDDPRLAVEPSLQGGWYAAPPTAAHQEFESRYAAAFGPLPAKVGILASSAYDATALAAALSRQNLDFSTANITNPGGFAGVDGLFRLLPDGSNDRGLAVREVTRAGPREVGPAPTSFNPVGQ